MSECDGFVLHSGKRQSANIQKPEPLPRSDSKREGGQALVETVVVAGAVLVPLLLGVVYAGKWAYTQDRAVEAARYAAWERVAWRSQPPAGREWLALRSDDELRQDLTVRYFGGRDEKLLADNARAAAGASSEPLFHKHDGKPLLTEREKHITLATHEEPNAMASNVMLMGALATAKFGGGYGIEMTGPTVATVSVTLDGIPQRLFSEVGLGKNLTFTAQGAVLTDPWSANGPAEAKKITEEFVNPPQIVGARYAQYPIKDFMVLLRGAGLLLGGLFSEVDRFKPSAQIAVDPELQFGDRLQPRQNIPQYTGP